MEQLLPRYEKMRCAVLCHNDNENFNAIIRYQGASSRSTSQNTKLKLKMKTKILFYTLSYVKTSFNAFSTKVFMQKFSKWEYIFGKNLNEIIVSHLIPDRSCKWINEQKMSKRKCRNRTHNKSSANAPSHRKDTREKVYRCFWVDSLESRVKKFNWILPNKKYSLCSLFTVLLFIDRTLCDERISFHLLFVCYCCLASRIWKKNKEKKLFHNFHEWRHTIKCIQFCIL